MGLDPMSPGVVLFTGAAFALLGLWAINHDGAMGSSGGWTSWVSPTTQKALAVFVLVSGLALCVWAAAQ